MRRRLWFLGNFVRILLGAGLASVANAGERGYVVSWFHLAAAAQSLESDCPKGLNASSEENFVRWLRELGKSPQEIEQLRAKFPQGADGIAATRGRINGQAVNVYANPTSVSDPVIHTVEGKLAYGFNLDGRSSSDSFVDPDTREEGVDNQLFRALGCIASERGEPNLRPTHTAGQWEINRLQAPAWLIALSGVDDLQNDPEVVVEIMRANDPVNLDATGEVLADATFTVDVDQATRNVVKGRIVNGLLSTDDFDLHMISHRYSILPEVDIKKAHLRATLGPDSSIKGYLGGYIQWVELYAGLARRGEGYETGVGIDVPGIYYTLRRMADADPDPSTGQHRAISGTFRIEGVPAFISRGAAEDAIR